jgi:MFS family permease
VLTTNSPTRWIVSNAALIVSARFFSHAGAFLATVALASYAYLTSRSAFVVGTYLASTVCGGIVASAFGPWVFRRWSGKRPLVLLDVLRAVALSVLVWWPPASVAWVLPPLGLVLGCGGSLFAIGLNSQLPQFVGAAQLIRVNALISSLSSIGAVIGSLLAGILSAAVGFRGLFVFTAGTYLASGLLVMGLSGAGTGSDKKLTRHHYIEEWKATRAVLRAEPVIAGMLLVALYDTLASSAHSVGMPIFSSQLDASRPARAMGLMLTGWGCGKLLGSAVAGLVGRGGERLSLRLQRMYFVGVVTMAAGFVFAFQQVTLVHVVALTVLAGLGDGLSEVAVISRIQQAPDHVQLPVFSIFTLLQMSGGGLGMLLATPFFSWWRPSQVVIAFHGTLLLVVLGVLVWLRKRSGREGELPVR